MTTRNWLFPSGARDIRSRAGIRIEPVDSRIAEASLEVLAASSGRTRKVLYWRPLISGVNDTDAHFDKVKTLAGHADAIAFAVDSLMSGGG